MFKIQIQYTNDEEMISAHCLKDEILTLLKEEHKDIKIINPDGKEE